MADVTFYSDGNGRWMRREWGKQCEERVFPWEECQGLKGHGGVHWCYRLDGSFSWRDNDADRRHDGCAGSTPPGHEKYVSPVEMQERHYHSHWVDTDVVDPKVIARLERDEIRKGESLNRPVRPNELEALEKENRVPKS
jgi:tRNA (cmo5U34)-methyltransferase